LLICPRQATPPATSTLYPYTTLFRSLRLLLQYLLDHSLQAVTGVHAQQLAVRFGEQMAVGQLHQQQRGIRGWGGQARQDRLLGLDRKSTRLNSSHVKISYAVFCLKKK